MLQAVVVLLLHTASVVVVAAEQVAQVRQSSHTLVAAIVDLAGELGYRK
jgi:hypothetical protein